MATEQQKRDFESYFKKRQCLTTTGIAQGLVSFYNQEFIEAARHVYFGGVPASLMLLCPEFGNGLCMNCIQLLANILKDYEYEVVYAEIDGLALNPKYIDEYKDEPDYTEWKIHNFIEVKGENGRKFVIDTSIGIMIDKDLYYKIENPKIVGVRSKEETENFIEYIEIKECDIESERYSAIPLIIKAMAISKTYQGAYKDEFKKEIEIVKKELDFYNMLKEEKENMERMGLRVS